MVTASQAAFGSDVAGSSITLRRASELPEALELARALRPLKRRHPSKRDLALDAEATVEYFSDTRVLMPVMRPGAERWFDVDVLVEVGPSMAVWQNTAAELVSLFQHHGAFREVRHWALDQVDGKVRLSSTVGARSEAPQLIDPAARRLTMIVTDCISPMWYRAPIWDAIRGWGLFSPVVLMTMLPSRLWPRTALGSPEVTMRSHRPGMANRSLDVTVPWWWPDDHPPQAAIPVPVITLEADSVAAWARMVMGVSEIGTPGVFATPAVGKRAARSGDGPRDAEERVQRFRVTVSPIAYRLAVYLSAALRGKWELALARVVQEALLPGSGQVHLAEVVVGGLVRQADPGAGRDEPLYEFVDGVVGVLQRSLTSTEALQVLQALAGHIKRETGRSPGIAAMLMGSTPPVDTSDRFGEVIAGAANLIQAMGLARAEDVHAPATDTTNPATAVTWAERKKAELLAELASFDAELAYWQAQAGPTGVLAKHNSQLARLADQLTPVLARVNADIGEAELGTSWPRFERQILDLHRVWDFFREKLALRYVGWFADYLLAADEYAWACYEPAQEAATAAKTVKFAAVREPPLVSFTPVSTPFSIPRGSSYAAAGLVTQESKALVQRLPVPVVGVPWFQLYHLPDALVIGHEVGHLVERDARLTATIERLTEQAVTGVGGGAERVAAWRGWASEAFADVYGSLAGGPAFVHALSDSLITAGAEPAGTRDYPPMTLRVALTAAVLPAAATGEREAAEAETAMVELRESWAADGIADLSGQAPEASAVARALVAGPYPELGGGPLSDVIRFDGKRLRDHREDAQALIERRVPRAGDARTLIAATGRAYALDPGTYQAADVPARVLSRMRAIQAPGVHGGTQFVSRDRTSADAYAAEELYEILIGENTSHS
jgi:hypothetical protein